MQATLEEGRRTDGGPRPDISRRIFIDRIVRPTIAAALAPLSMPAFAQAYPSRPIRVIVPFTAGGIVDIIARDVAARLGPTLGQPMVVENRTGASGSIGIEAVARAQPDGYTLLLASGVMTINVAMKPDLPWHPVRSFAPVAMIATSPQVLIVNPNVPARTLAELVDLARAKPGKLTFGSVGVGSTPHLTVELLKAATSTDMIHVPYRGQPEVINDVVQGNISLTSVTLSLAVPMIRTGQVRALAVTTARRSLVLPDVPTIAESGVQPFDVPNWFGLVAPKNTPEAVVGRLYTEIAKAAATSDFSDKLARLGAEPSVLSPQDFQRFIEVDLARWTDVVRGAHLDSK